MHELAVCQALIGQVTDVARDNKASTVSDIYVSVGPLSGVEGPLMQNAFPIAAAGTVAKEVTLHLDATPISAMRGMWGRVGSEDEPPGLQKVR